MVPIIIKFFWNLCCARNEGRTHLVVLCDGRIAVCVTLVRFLTRTAMGTPNALVSLCVRDMQGQRAVLSTNAAVQDLPNLSGALAADIINRYAMHTSVVMINLSDLQTFEYVRPIDETNVQKLVRSMLVSRG